MKDVVHFLVFLLDHNFDKTQDMIKIFVYRNKLIYASLDVE